MSFETITIGSAPGEENCAQVGRRDYDEESRRECRVFIRQLERTFPIPEGLPVSYRTVVERGSDMGSYREVGIKYDETSEAAADYAYMVENKAPANWDAQARFELTWYFTRDLYRGAVEANGLDQAFVPDHLLQAEPPQLREGCTAADWLIEYPMGLKPGAPLAEALRHSETVSARVEGEIIETMERPRG